MPSQLTRVLEYRDLPVTVTWRRTSKVTLRVGAHDGAVRVSVPHGTPGEAALQMVQLNWDWLVERRREALARAAAAPRLETGQEVPLWGRPVPLVVQDGVKARAVVGRGHIMLTADDEAAARQALDALYRRELEPRVDELVARWAPRVGRGPSTIRFRRMRTRWGSCRPETGAMTFNIALAERDPSVLEFVVVHELVHLLEPRHGAAFHARMDRLLPDHRQRHRMLKGQPCS